MPNSDEPSPQERKTAFIEELQSYSEVININKLTRSIWEVHTNEGQCTVYLHYYKYFREPRGPPGYFQGSWDLTDSADPPLYHVFLGPSEQSVRVVPNEDLMSPKFNIIPDHNDGDEWRLNVNSSSNDTRLEGYMDVSLITKMYETELEHRNEKGEELQNLAKDILESESDDST